jgi:hypothetical protein
MLRLVCSLLLFLFNKLIYANYDFLVFLIKYIYRPDFQILIISLILFEIAVVSRGQ